MKDYSRQTRYIARNPEKRAKWQAISKERRKAERAYMKANDPVGYAVLLARGRRGYAKRGPHLRNALKVTHMEEPIECECCGAMPSKRLHFDHCHVTGRFRGWLCGKCNTGIGLLGDSLETVMLAVQYLQRSATRQS